MRGSAPLLLTQPDKYDKMDNIQEQGREHVMSQFCIVHGRIHQPGETDSVDTVGDSLYCRTEEWPVVEGSVITSQCEPITEAEAFFTVAAGDLAYLDTFSGLVPVKVGSVDEDGETEVKVTAGREGYRRGEVIEMHLPNITLISRSQVYRSRGRLMVAGPVRFVTDEGALL